MKKTVKLLCVFLALIITVLPLISCSEAELGYLAMVSGMMKNGGNMAIEQEIVIDINDALEEELFSSILADTVAPEDYPDTITITYTGKESLDEVSMDIDVIVSVGELASFGCNYSFVDETLYFGELSYEIDEEAFDVEALFGASKESFDETVFILSNAIEGLGGVEYFSASPYVSVTDVEYDTPDEYTYEDYLAVLTEQLTKLIYENMDQVYPMCIKLLENAFSSYSTGIVSKIENGYRISADADAMVQVLVSFVEYILSNPDKLLDSVAVFADDLAEIAGKSGNEELKEILVLAGEEIRLSKEEVDSDATTASVEEIIDNETIEELKALLKGTSFVLDITEKDGVYTETATATIVAQGVVIATIDINSTVKPCEAFEIEAKEPSIPLGDAFEYIYAYPYISEGAEIEEMRITWDGTEGTSEVYGTLLYDFTKEEYALGLYDFHNIDGSMYLPMRRICERFGEVVDWDAVNGKAYVVRGEEKIDMTGRIIGDRTFIKIRDFEKLGYMVDYKVDESGRPWAILNALPSIEAQLADVADTSVVG